MKISVVKKEPSKAGSKVGSAVEAEYTKQGRKGFFSTGKSLAQGKANTKTKDEIVNPYLNVKRIFRDNNQALMNSRLWFAIFAVISMLLAFGGVTVSLYSAAHSEYVPYVVAVNDHGVAIASGLARETQREDEKLISATVSEFIENMRTVTLDYGMQRRMTYWVLAHLTDMDPARSKALTYFNESNPFERARKMLVDVSIKSVVKQDGSTWQVEWIESERSRLGELLSDPKKMRALVTWGYGPQKTELEEIKYNPLAIYIRDYNWNEVVQ